MDVAIYALSDAHVGRSLSVGGLVAGRRSFLTRRGDPMGVLTVEEPPGSIEVTVFPKLWQRVVTALDDDQVVVVAGKIEGDESGGFRMVAENIYPVRPDEISIDAEPLLSAGSAVAVAPSPTEFDEVPIYPSSEDEGDVRAETTHSNGLEATAPLYEDDVPVGSSERAMSAAVAGSLAAQAAGADFPAMRAPDRPPEGQAGEQDSIEGSNSMDRQSVSMRGESALSLEGEGDGEGDMTAMPPERAKDSSMTPSNDPPSRARKTAAANAGQGLGKVGTGASGNDASAARVVVRMVRAADASADLGRLAELDRVVKANPGAAVLELHIVSNGDTTRLRWSEPVTVSADLETQLASTFGADNVVRG